MALAIGSSISISEVRQFQRDGTLVAGRDSRDRNQQTGAAGRTSENDGEQLSPSDQRRVDELKEIDRKVRAHELAHIAAGGGVVQGGASYRYATGPDGKRYAVAGEVPIDSSPGNTPEETILKAEAIRRAALAPADPSPTDRRVAAQAAAIAAEARLQIARLANEEAEEAASAGSGVLGATRQDDRVGLYSRIGASSNSTAQFSAAA